GASFNTFLGNLCEAIQDNSLALDDEAKLNNVPFCVAVQEEHYLAVQPTMGWQDVPFYLCAIDLSKLMDSNLPSIDGIETGLFLEIYGEVLRQRRDGALNINLYSWFNKLPIDATGKAWIARDGKVSRGEIPFKV